MRSSKILVAAFIANMLMGCAPPGYMYDTGSFVAHPIDFCQRKEPMALLIGGLRKTAGMGTADLVDVSTTYRNPVPGPSQIEFSCHGTIITPAGAHMLGIVTISEDENGALKAAWVSDASSNKTPAPVSQSRPESSADRVRKSCTSGSQDVCTNQINLESMCVEYRNDAVAAYGYKLVKLSASVAAQSIMESYIPALPDEPMRTPQVSEDDLVRLIQAAYSVHWATPEAFETTAYQRCLAGKNF